MSANLLVPTKSRLALWTFGRLCTTLHACATNCIRCRRSVWAGRRGREVTEREGLDERLYFVPWALQPALTLDDDPVKTMNGRLWATSKRVKRWDGEPTAAPRSSDGSSSATSKPLGA